MAAMIRKGTTGVYSLRALEPRSGRPLIETYATSSQAAARRASLEQAGYTVIVTLGETGGEGRPARGRKPPWWIKGPLNPLSGRRDRPPVPQQAAAESGRPGD